MSARIPMPSPRGTNKAGLFVSFQRPASGPTLAMDAALQTRRRMALDTAADDFQELSRLLSENLDDATLTKCHELIERLLDATAPPAFAGRPTPGGSPLPAQDRGLIMPWQRERMRRVVAQSQAARQQAQDKALVERFPAAARGRVIG